MREYSFVRIRIRRARQGATLERDHQEVIREQAAAGWQFVQAIEFDRHPQPHFDLVFTREGKQ